MRSWYCISALGWLLFSCTGHHKPQVSASEPVKEFTWNNHHVLHYDLGDSVAAPVLLEQDSTEFGIITMHSEGEEEIANINARFKPYSVEDGYSKIQSYYNNLFDTQETDSSWSYWSFDIGDGIPRELYLFNHGEEVEIRAYTASQF